MYRTCPEYLTGLRGQTGHGVLPLSVLSLVPRPSLSRLLSQPIRSSRYLAALHDTRVNQLLQCPPYGLLGRVCRRIREEGAVSVGSLKDLAESQHGASWGLVREHRAYGEHELRLLAVIGLAFLQRHLAPFDHAGGGAVPEIVPCPMAVHR